ncbi:DUF1217 domain-containing protein [Pseudoxanthobacter sp. M-2]|uniref:DUF1217 domain-containing protein n=1 Tax=Pseudoxanthobacter sp. M-2 TaxID=3078754 RepID=UPI0038FCDF1D
MLSTYTSYKLITRDLDRSLTLKASERQVALESDYYLENIGKVETIDDFLDDTRLFKFAMKAFGLEEMSYAKAYMRKVLTEGISADDAFVKRLSDDRFTQFATMFNFEGKGSSAVEGSAVRQGVVDRYVRQSLEVSAGEENEGVRLALYFQRSAASVTSAYGILADEAIQEVVFTALGFPDEMKAANIDRQAAAIEARLDIASLQDPKEVEKLLTRFTALWDAASSTNTSPLLMLFETSSAPSVGLDLVMSLQNLKRGGY